MRVSRRDFVSMTGAAVCSFRPLLLNLPDSQPATQGDCALLDLGSGCALRESLEGYQAALAGKCRELSLCEFSTTAYCRTTIVPGIGVIEAELAAALSSLLKTGNSLLLESGAGFLSPPEFTSHQKMLHRYFDIIVDQPIEVWSAPSVGDVRNTARALRYPMKKLDDRRFVPYVHYQWPSETKVRDFSRVVAVLAQAGKAIGKLGDLSVAWKTRVGAGTLIFLGSPMGPALRAGDLDAQAWLQSVTAL